MILLQQGDCCKKTFTLLIWAKLPVPHIQWKHVHQRIKNRCRMYTWSLAVWLRLSVRPCARSKQQRKHEAEMGKLKPTALERICFFFYCSLIHETGSGELACVGQLRCYDPDARRPNMGNPFPDFTSGKRINWGFCVLQGGGYLSNSPLWSSGCHHYTWSWGVAVTYKRKLFVFFSFNKSVFNIFTA